MKNLYRLFCFFFIAVSALQHAHGQSIYNIVDFGAKGDGTTISTEAIQRAIDSCSANGGGQVLIPNGVFLSATIMLKEHVALYLDATAVLKGVADMEAYSHLAFIYAEDQDNIAILGRGTIHGHGEHEVFRSRDKFNGQRGRPNTIHFLRCNNVRLKEFTVINGARWNIKLQENVNVAVDDIRVLSRAVANNDGIDIVDCHNVRIANSYFDCGDDGICPKSDSKMGVKNLVITNCIVKSESNAIKFGTSGVGGFEDVTISNCVLYDTRLSGIALELVDGGVMDRITISNVTMHNVNGGIFIKLGKRKGDGIGALRNVKIDNIIADGIGNWLPDTSAAYYKDAHDQRIGMTITGQPGYPIENVTLSNIYMRFAGGGTIEDSQRVMEDRPAVYPEYTNYGITPAYGFNCRYVKNLRFDGVELDFQEKDQRPAILMEEVTDVTLSAFRARISNDAPAVIQLNNVQDAFVHGCRPMKSTVPFISLAGNTQDISIMNNDFSQIQKPYVLLAGNAENSSIRTLNNITR